MKNKFLTFLPWLLILAGFFLRIYRLENLAGFDYDQEVAAWWIKSLLVDHKLSLVGQEISAGGTFIGPLFYYLLAGFYRLFRLDPIAANVLVSLLSLATMGLLFRVALRLFGYKSAILALLLYVVSSRLNFYDRTTAPSNLLMALSLAAFYVIKFCPGLKGWLLLGIISGLGVNSHPTALFLPLIALFYYLWQERQFPPVRWLAIFFLALAPFVLPIVVFDLRHNFIGLRHAVITVSQANFSLQSYPPPFKFLINLRTLTVTLVNLVAPAVMALQLVTLAITLWFFAALRTSGKLLWLWLLIPLIFLSFYKMVVPEYYFLICFPIFLIFLANFLAGKTATALGKFALIGFLLAMVLINLTAQKNYSNDVGLADKRAAVRYIRQNSGALGSEVFFDTDLGQGNGFYYLFYLYGFSSSRPGGQRYIIVIPANRNREAGPVFGDIKVVHE